MIPDVIPEFQEMPLNAMTDLFIDGDWIESKDMSDSGIRVIQTGNIGTGEVLEKSDKARYISQSTFERLNCTALQSGDILICRLADPVGRCVQVPEWMDGSVTSVDVTIVRCNVEIIRSRFLMYLLNSEETLGRVRSLIQGTTRGRISRSKLGELPLTIPCSLEIQDSIISILDNLDSLITVKRTLTKKLGHIREGMLNDFLTYGIDEDGVLRSPETHEFVDTQIGPVPSTWTIGPIGNFLQLQRGHDLPLSARNEGHIRIFGSNGVDGTHDTQMYDGPGVITGRSGTIGKIHFVETSYWPLNTTLFVREFHGNNPRFIAYFLEFLRLKRYSTGTGVPTLNRNLVHPTICAFPQIVEQNRIVIQLQSIDARINSETRLLKKYQKMKMGLMSDLLTGRVRIPTPGPGEVEVTA